MIKVGINENVQLKSAEINEKGTLVITFAEAGAKQQSTVDLLNSKTGVKAGGTTNIMLWSIQTEDQGKTREADRIAKDITSMRDQLEHVLEQYLTSDNAKLDPYVGTDLTADNFESLIVKQSVVDRMYNNLASQFVTKVRTLGADLDNTFRLLLVRKSAGNHYGTFRRNFITDNPFMESMNIPAAASKLKFTKYEISKGLNNGDAVAKPAAEAATETTSATDDILGTR